MAKHFLTHLECAKCKKTYVPDQPQQLCACGSPLLARYDLAKLGEGLTKNDLFKRKANLWRYRELLPVSDPDNIVSLGESMTPMLPLQKIGASIGLDQLFLKDEGIIPTGTFKARGAAVGVSKAKELGVKVLAMPTNGNAGSAWSAYAARAGIKTYIVMPEDAPLVTRKECAITGANLYLVNGLISDAGKIVGRAIAKYGWYDASTLKEPYRIEGKKTMGLEIAEQFDWSVPDVIIYPTGGGVGLIGIYKAMQELRAIGWIGEKLPRLVAAQASGCAPIVRAWKHGQETSEFWPDAKTIAFGINVPKALGDFLVLEAIYATNGCAIAVDDSEILSAQQHLAAAEGMFVCPEGAATFAAAVKLKKQGWLRGNEKVVLLNTGAGVKYPDTVQVSVPVLQPGDDLPVTGRNDF